MDAIGSDPASPPLELCPDTIELASEFIRDEHVRHKIVEKQNDVLPVLLVDSSQFRHGRERLREFASVAHGVEIRQQGRVPAPQFAFRLRA